MQSCCQWKAVVGNGSCRNDPGGIVVVAFPSSCLPQCLFWLQVLIARWNQRSSQGFHVCLQRAEVLPHWVLIPRAPPLGGLHVTNMDLAFSNPGSLLSVALVFLFPASHLNVYSFGIIFQKDREKILQSDIFSARA